MGYLTMMSELSVQPTSALCAVCRRPISLTAAGLVRLHGPVASRCPGSRCPPTLSQVPPRIPPSSSARSPGLQGVDSSQPSTQPPQPPLEAPPPLPPRCSVKIIKRIPRASRGLAGAKLASILERVVRDNDHASWDHLLRFGSRCLRVPARGGHRRSLVAAINRQLGDEQEEVCPSAPLVSSRARRARRPPQDPLKSLASRVSMKLEEGDFRGAIRLACSEDTIAESNDTTFAALQLKHPPPHPSSPFLLSLKTHKPTFLCL